MRDFVMDKIRKMRMSGLKEIDVAQFFGFSTTIDLRHMISQRHRANRIVLASMAKEMKEARKDVSEIASELGMNESTIRLLDDDFNHISICDENVRKDLEQLGTTVDIKIPVKRA